MKRLNPTGFTIVELMIASTVFSVILILISVGLISVGRVFFKGVTLTNTQEVTGVITEDIVSSIQLSGEKVTFPIKQNVDGITKGFCIGTRRYSYLEGKQLSDSSSLATDQAKHVFMVDRVPSCNETTEAQSLSPSSSPEGKELLSPKMRLGGLKIEPKGNGLYSVTVRVVYGDGDLLCNNNPVTGSDCNAPAPPASLEFGYISCRDSIGSQFCGVSELTTSAYKRIQ
jgi:prepilin-type N-terminal cleavage/methylation domain-containing protein